MSPPAAPSRNPVARGAPARGVASRRLGGLLLLALAACGGEPSSLGPGDPPGPAVAGDEGGTQAGSGMPVPKGAWNPYPELGPPAIRLRDWGPGSRITTVNHSGTAGVKEFLIEAVGVGPAFLDYDRDGLLDIYIPDGDEFLNYTLEQALDPATGTLQPRLRRKAQPVVTFRDQLWRNNGDGTFTDVAARAGVADERWSFGATAADLDGDGWTDLYVSNYGRNRLYMNNRDGTFTDRADERGAAVSEDTWSTCAAVADLDGDGRLDLYVAAYADPAAEVDKQRAAKDLPQGTPVEAITGRACRWKRVLAYCGPIGLVGQHDTFLSQQADGSYEDRTVAVGMRPPVARYGFQALAWDWNEDGRMDVYVANDSVESFLFQAELGRDGALRFRELAEMLGVKYGANVQPQAGMGASVADINRDGLFDIFKTNFALDYNNMYLAHRTRPQGGQLYFKDRGLAALGQPLYFDLKWGCGWVDLDNDGDLDLFVANGHVYKEVDLQEQTGSSYDQLNALVETIDQGRLGYREIGRKAVDRLGPAGAHLACGDGMDIRKCSRGAGFADLNNDGRLDIVVTNMNAPPDVLVNDTPPAAGRNWALLGLEQPGPNREALGATLEIRAGDLAWKQAVIRSWSFLGSNDPREHVGLGPATTFDVTVTWPGLERAQTTYRGLKAGTQWTLRREGGQAVEVPLKAFAWPLPPEVAPAR